VLTQPLSELAPLTLGRGDSLRFSTRSPISTKHPAVAVARKRSVPTGDYDKLARSYRHLSELLRARDGDAAEAHWRRHINNSRQIFLRLLPTIKVRDVMD
jgi:GntR family transcriptional regulator, transcriptional repressor for pyruvate dehydrogenase complex